MHHIQFNNKKENSFSESDKMIKIKNSVDRELEKIRKNKRFHFNMNSGFMKLSTVHSFKGWEIKTLFLIIDKESESLNEEIIYTGLTRCRENLIIINKGNIQYDNFFRKFVTH